MPETLKARLAGRPAGSIELLEDGALWLLHAPKVAAGIDRDAAVTELLKRALARIPLGQDFRLILLDTEDPALFESTARIATGRFSFRLEQVKCVFTRSLESMPAADWRRETELLAYRDFEDLGFDFFARLLERIQSDSLDFFARQAVQDPAKELVGLQDPERYIPHLWQAAFFAGTPVGMMLPGRADDEGVIQFMGVEAEWRGRGFGSIIHRKAMLLLREQGLKQYVGSTDRSNLPMIRLFKKTCQFDCSQHIFRRD